MLFSELEVWFDPVAREGAEAMAVDEVLLETRKLPLLRVYGWNGDWGSLGYFGKLKEAEAAFPGLKWVRRWTGGGVVDHRCDWTYSLVVPRALREARMRSGECYHAIHNVLTGVLNAEGNATGLSGGKAGAGGVCFDNPVEHDVVDGAGKKIAGAAQRRGRAGLLHQGSVAKAVDGRLRGGLFAQGLSENWTETELEPDPQMVAELVAWKYGANEWLGRC